MFINTFRLDFIHNLLINHVAELQRNELPLNLKIDFLIDYFIKM